MCLTRIRPARTTSDGKTAGQCIPWHSCLCSAKCLMSELQMPGEVTFLIYRSRSSDKSSLNPYLVLSFGKSSPPAWTWHFKEQYNGIEQETHGTVSAGSSLKQKAQWVSRQCFNIICSTTPCENWKFSIYKCNCDLVRRYSFSSQQSCQDILEIINNIKWNYNRTPILILIKLMKGWSRGTFEFYLEVIAKEAIFKS